MDPLLAWLGKLIGTVMAGPGAVVLGDPGIDVDPQEKPWSPLTKRIVGLVLVLSILVIGGLPWQVPAIVGVVGAGLIGLEWLGGRLTRA